MVGNNEQRSYAQFSIKEKNQNPKCGFSEHGDTLVVITQTGQYYEADIKKGNLTQKTMQELLNANRTVAQNSATAQGQGGM